MMSVKSAHKTISVESFFRQSVNHVISSQITIFKEQQVTQQSFVISLTLIFSVQCVSHRIKLSEFEVGFKVSVLFCVMCLRLYIS